jgi:16S rRNA (cytidine1402-2'-O)-methyltransferase
MAMLGQSPGRAGMSQLTLVGTPIGNLGDITLRAVEALKRADVIACEDTRVTRKLLSHLGITGRKLLKVAEHNEMSGAQEIIGELDSGKNVVMVTDAGMPGVSDPGARVVGEVLAAGHEVTVAPGPSALTAAASLSLALTNGRFIFEGFLPVKGVQRQKRLEQIAVDERGVMLYESPHKLAKTLNDLSDACGRNRRIELMRELTKLHEEVWRGTVAEGIEHVVSQPPRGEYVIVVAGAPTTEVNDAHIIEVLNTELKNGSSLSAAATKAAQDLQISRSRAYGLALSIKPKNKSPH